MPELPEVETIKRGLVNTIKRKTVSELKVLWPGILNMPAKKANEIVRGAKILDINRKAKILVINLDNTFSFLIHLKITGQLIYLEKDAKIKNKEELWRFTRAIFYFTDGSQLLFNDLRKFAYLKLVKNSEVINYIGKEKLGPEPLEKDFTLEIFSEIIKNHPKVKIKQLMMDQKTISGIGNLYSDEICFYAKVLPIRKASILRDEEIAKIYQGIKKILESAISHQGSSVDTYITISGQKGDYERFLKVYGRENQNCYICKTKIKRIKLGGRSSYFCSRCQK